MSARLVTIIVMAALSASSGAGSRSANPFFPRKRRWRRRASKTPVFRRALAPDGGRAVTRVTKLSLMGFSISRALSQSLGAGARRRRAVAALPITAGCWARRPSTRRDRRGAGRRLDRHISGDRCSGQHDKASRAGTLSRAGGRDSASARPRPTRRDGLVAREPRARRCDHRRITELPVGGVRRVQGSSPFGSRLTRAISASDPR